jgi:hypothetical protein
MLTILLKIFSSSERRRGKILAMPLGCLCHGEKEKERAWPKFMVFFGPCEVYILYIKLLRGAEASVVL